MNQPHTWPQLGLSLMIPGTASARGIKHPPVSGLSYVSGDTAMADYSDVLDEATLALISEIDQIHRSEKPQDTVKYVNSLMSLGRHLQLQEFRSWLNHKCGLPITVRPSDVDLKEYMETAQIEEWIHEWTQKHATDRSGRMLSLFLQHEFQVNVKDTMKPCNGCCWSPCGPTRTAPMTHRTTTSFAIPAVPQPQVCWVLDIGFVNTQNIKLTNVSWPWNQPQPTSPGESVNSEPWKPTGDTSHPRGTWLYHHNGFQHQTRPSSYTPGMKTPNVGSSCPWQRPTRPWSPPNTQSKSGSNWFTACTSPASFMPRKNSRQDPEPAPTEASEMPSSEPIPPSPSARPNDNSLNTKSS